jgi:hypothetical protein
MRLMFHARRNYVNLEICFSICPMHLLNDGWTYPLHLFLDKHCLALNELNLHRTEKKIIESVVEHEKSKLETAIIEFLGSQERKLVYYGEKRNEIQDASLDVGRCIDTREKNKLLGWKIGFFLINQVFCCNV